MLDNVGLRYPHRTSGTKAPRTLRPLPLLRFAASATGGAHLCSIQYYLRFWLSICRTSLAVSALRIMRYCLNFLPRWGAALPPLPGLFCFLCLQKQNTAQDFSFPVFPPTRTDFPTFCPGVFSNLRIIFCFLNFRVMFQEKSYFVTPECFRYKYT